MLINVSTEYVIITQLGNTRYVINAVWLEAMTQHKMTQNLEISKMVSFWSLVFWWNARASWPENTFPVDVLTAGKFRSSMTGSVILIVLRLPGSDWDRGKLTQKSVGALSGSGLNGVIGAVIARFIIELRGTVLVGLAMEVSGDPIGGIAVGIALGVVMEI